jgi:hypothetical protein
MLTKSLDRRGFLRASAAAVATISGGLTIGDSAAARNEFPPTRVITRGPRHHWFGYYDKFQFDPTSRYVLGMAVDFEGRSPTADDDNVRIGMVDLQDGDRWIELGTSQRLELAAGLHAPVASRSSTEDPLERPSRVIVSSATCWTRNQGNVARSPRPIYSVSPDGKSAVTTDFRRIADVRPGYGYAGFPDPHCR